MPKISTRPMSASRRKTLATHQITIAVGSDQAAAVTAALEVVAERLTWDSDVQRSMGQKYAELVELSKPKQPSTGSATLKPIAVPSSSYNPLANIDPYRLHETYGADQLRTVLMQGSAALLREAVDVVQKREPGTKPASRTKKADMIDYIVEHVVGPSY